MKITLNQNSYMIIEKDGCNVTLGVKTKQGKESFLLTTVLERSHLDTLITQLISMRARLNDVEEESK
jgi:hypothetical protein